MKGQNRQTTTGYLYSVSESKHSKLRSPSGLIATVLRSQQMIQYLPFIHITASIRCLIVESIIISKVIVSYSLHKSEIRISDQNSTSFTINTKYILFESYYYSYYNSSFVAFYQFYINH
jgi:hypothetical protein